MEEINMSEKTEIAWTDSTFNPWWGCQKVGPGCDSCYAESLDRRTGGAHWGPGAERRRTSVKNWNDPIRWNKKADAFFAEHGRRQRVFCASMADVFDNEVDPQWRNDLWELIWATPNLDWLLLTKRIGNVPAMLPFEWGNGMIDHWPNVWIGATVVNQTEADRDIPKLLAVPAAKRFLSIEPLLGPVNLRNLNEDKEVNELDCLKPYTWDEEIEPWRQSPAGLIGPMHAGIDWVIVGGESGHGARPMHPDWARSLRDQCDAAGVAFMFKQWGEFSLAYDRDRDDPDYQRCDAMARKPGRWINIAGGHGFNGQRVHYAEKVGKKAAGRLLDGREWNGVPA